MSKNQTPILITGVERSGSSFVSHIFKLCGAFTGDVNTMYENKILKRITQNYISKKTKGYGMPDLSNVEFPEWNVKVLKLLQYEGLKSSDIFCYKDSNIAQSWQLWQDAFPQANWVIVRRRTGDILNSCKKTGYMKKFKDNHVLKELNFKTEEDGWLWWIHQYEDRFIAMENAGIKYHMIYPARFKDGDYSQIKEVVDSFDLKWNPDIEKIITPLFK